MHRSWDCAVAALTRSLGLAALGLTFVACAQDEVHEREASLGVVWSESDEPGTRPREEAAGTGSIPDEPLNVPPEPQPPSDVLWTPTPGLPGVAAE